jgi:hypothetical protein
MKTGISPPHSLEAEECLLSACMLDGSDTISRCFDAGITAASFYDPRHATLFGVIGTLHVDGQPVEASVIAQELKRSKQLDGIGGYPFIVQVSSRVPTTANANYHITQVSELSTQREIIRAFTRGIEQAYESPSIECLDSMDANLSAIRHRSTAAKLTSFPDMELPEEDGPNELLGHNRYLGRGDQCLIVSSSGMGKSSLSMIWAAHLALGRDFLGIATKRPSKSVVFQAEDSDGDMGELWFSVKTTMKLTPEEVETVRKNVIVIRDKVNRGDAFISSMRAICAKVKPDFVWLNPLHSFAGCKIEDATEIGQFLRQGLNKANRDDQWCYMIIHHTPKPMTGKAVADKKWHEFMYDAAGSAELVNWARGVITLKPTAVRGEFNLVLAKRGKRAGVMQETQGEVTTFLQPTINIAIKQSCERIMLPGRKRPFHLLNWETRIAAPEAVEEPKVKKGNTSMFKPTHNPVEVLRYYPDSKSEGEGFGVIKKDCEQGCGVKDTLFKSLRLEFLASAAIQQTPDHRYRRTAKGDAMVDELNKKTP